MQVEDVNLTQGTEETGSAWVTQVYRKGLDAMSIRLSVGRVLAWDDCPHVYQLMVCTGREACVAHPRSRTLQGLRLL